MRAIITKIVQRASLDEEREKQGEMAGGMGRDGEGGMEREGWRGRDGEGEGGMEGRGRGQYIQRCESEGLACKTILG
jgi:hypothetical protein